MLRGTAATRCGTGGERPSSAATSNAPASVSCLVSCLSQVPGATLWRRRGARATARWAHPPGCCRPRNWPRECRLTSAVRTKTPSLFPKRCPENALGRNPMAQQVTITIDAQIALKPLIEAALRSELRMLELSIQRTAQRLRAFEAQYGMASDEFERRFNAGGVEESLDFIEWAGEIKTYQLLDAQRQALQGVQLT